MEICMNENSHNEGNQSASAGSESQDSAVEILRADVERWKSLSRQNEKSWNEARTELSRIKEASTTDAEKAVEAAREEARSTALAEVSPRLVEAELRAQAATTGVQLPPTQHLDVKSFLGADGSPNVETIQAFVAGLPQPAKTPLYAQDIGLGPRGEGGYAAGQISRDTLSRMSREEISAARKAGRLDSLMNGNL
ncbi:hypothetical protein [Streptomyces sp. NPDC005955]|uniref:hypothetical protein n=1 Tax=Streptomyces sp. NPDC005955 TaxID=3364738 RepID=UPI0036A9D24A